MLLRYTKKYYYFQPGTYVLPTLHKSTLAEAAFLSRKIIMVLSRSRDLMVAFICSIFVNKNPLKTTVYGHFKRKA